MLLFMDWGEIPGEARPFEDVSHVSQANCTAQCFAELHSASRVGPRTVQIDLDSKLAHDSKSYPREPFSEASSLKLPGSMP